VQVRETTLRELLGGSKQFRVPLFQRTYSWSDKDHALLWRDILRQYEQFVEENKTGATNASRGHFIGSFVLAPSPSSAALPAFLVVDGQQRLTTLLVALAALRQVSATSDPKAADRITNEFLINQYAEGEERWKFVPTEADRRSFQKCMEGSSLSDSDLVTQAYRFYEKQLALLGSSDEPIDHRILEQVMVSQLSIIDITAQPGDNVYRIFESLNATGVDLTQADLLRNYLFMLLPNRGPDVYRDVWLPMQNLLGSGNLEGLARVDLRRRGIAVREDDVYRTQQIRLAQFENDEAAIEQEVRELASQADHYSKILKPELEDHPEIRRLLSFLQRWNANTTHPLLMYLYDAKSRGRISIAEMVDVMRNIESFLVRRLLIGVQSRNLNRIFLDLVSYLREHSAESVVQVVRLQLSTGRKYWASDAEIRHAARSRTFYHYGRAMQRRLILERLEESYGNLELGDLSALALTVEHIMPQTLTPEWIQMLSTKGEDASNVHEELVHTLGNLTLTAYNPELSNDPFERKQQIFESSHLSLNAALSGVEVWTRVEIESRAEEMADRAITIWPGPMSNQVSSEGSFDWSRIHAAIAAIPDGRWTSYRDLAIIGGTAAQPLGTHISSNPGLFKAYRVLTSNGEISPNFHWADENDPTDPVKLLTREGVKFLANGRADPTYRISSEGLAALIDDLDLDDLIDGPDNDG